MKCQICGESSGYFPLCKYHNDLKNEGLVKKNEHGEWVVIDEENKNCIICGKETSNNNIFCWDCYKKVKEQIKKFDHNRKAEMIEDHYFKLKKNLQKSKNKDEFNEKIILLRALADEYHIIYESDYLTDRVKNDILKEYEQFKSKNSDLKNNTTFDDEDFRNKWPREHQCDDGHYVRSLSEMIIDNYLYHKGLVHAYEKSVFMNSNPDAVVLSDFYLPQGDVYIEFWGLEDDEKYQKRKEQKIKLYDENKINRIDLTEKDIKRLNDIMPKLLAKFNINVK